MIAPVLLTTLLAVNVPAVRVASTAAPVKCSAPAACALYENTGTGLTIEAESSDGFAAGGVTNSGSFLDPGVEAESDAVTGSDAAAGFGINFLFTGKAPAYGALAYGGLNGLYGATESNGQANESAAGIFGQDDGVSAEPDYNAGVLGSTANGTGVVAEAYATPGPVEFGYVPMGLYTVAEPIGNGPAYGLVAESDGTAFTTTSDYETVQLAGVLGLVSSVAYGEYGTNSDTQHYYFDVDSSGNGYFSGTVSASQAPQLRTRGASGTRRTAYEIGTASPQIDDVGEGQLTNGRGDVTLDPALADSIDMRRPYQVFVTPEGDCNGLYVAQKTPAGFVVREQQGGHATLAFSYRIVGKPFDDDGARFAVPPARPKLAARFAASGRHVARIGAPMSPEARLRERLGTQAYAEALLEKRAAETSSVKAMPSAPPSQGLQLRTSK